MKILLLGANGQVGWALRRSLSILGSVTALGREGSESISGDISDIDAMEHAIATLNPDVIVNAAADTAVDKAESEPEPADSINHEAVKSLAHLARKYDALLVHYSTDYVFDGSGEAEWTEKDVTNPINQYGRSKLKGEKAIQQSGCRAIIFRTSWVYSSFGNSFLGTMMRLMQERESLSIVSDQFGAPTSADLIADVTGHVVKSIYQHQSTCEKLELNEGATLLFHLVAKGVTNWCEYAGYIRHCMLELDPSLQLAELNPVNSSEYPVAAPRPLNSRMSTERLERMTGLEMPDWKIGVAQAVAERFNARR